METMETMPAITYTLLKFKVTIPCRGGIITNSSEVVIRKTEDTYFSEDSTIFSKNVLKW